MNTQQTRFLLEPEGIDLLQAYGIPYPQHSVAYSSDEAVEIADQLGYPVVLKVISPDVLHKSDVGGVVIGIKRTEEVRDAYGRIESAIVFNAPGADMQGTLVIKQAGPGLEVIVGGLKDALFGPSVMFGLGGVFVEILKDVSFRVAPLKQKDAEEMVKEIQGYPLLKGARGKQPYDVSAVTHLLCKVSELLIDRPDISELDLNPVRVFENGLLVLDVRVLISKT
jgi:acyl-CoA synthetase (NDP forming)